MTFDEAKNEIKNKIDIVDIIGKDVNLKPLSGGDFIGLCPFHSEKTPSFHVRRNQQYYHCFGCGASGDVFSYLENHDQMSFKESMDYLCNKIGITYENTNFNNTEFNNKKQKVYDIYKETAKEYFKILVSDKGKKGQEYFVKRGLTIDTIKRFGLGYAPNEKNYIYNHLKNMGFTDAEIIDDAKVAAVYNDVVYDVWRDRAMFPILDRMNKVITFSGRALSDNDDRKYVNGYATIIFDKSNNLFCLNMAQKTKENYFILCEGNMDCISLYQAGYTNAIAPLGTAFTERQASLLTRYGKKVYIAMDSDDAGVHAIRTKTIPYLSSLGIDSKVINLKPCKDPDEFIVKYGKDKFDERIMNAQDSVIFDVLCMKNDYNLSEETGKRDYIFSVVKKISSFENKITRNIYIESISKNINIDEKMLSSYVDEYMRNNNIVNDDKKFDEVSFSNKKVEENKKLIDKNELKFLEILTDHLELVDKIKNYIDKNDLQNELCKNIYNDLLVGTSIEMLIKKYSNVDFSYIDDDKNVDKYTKKLASDIIATNSNMSIEEAKLSLSTLIKKIKIKQLENNIKMEKDQEKLSKLLVLLKTTKNCNYEL